MTRDKYVNYPGRVFSGPNLTPRRVVDFDIAKFKKRFEGQIAVYTDEFGSFVQIWPDGVKAAPIDKRFKK